MFPREAENAAWDARVSVLIPSTWVSFSSNFRIERRNEEVWSVQPPVKQKT